MERLLDRVAVDSMAKEVHIINRGWVNPDEFSLPRLHRTPGLPTPTGAHVPIWTIKIAAER